MDLEIAVGEIRPNKVPKVVGNVLSPHGIVNHTPRKRTEGVSDVYEDQAHMSRYCGGPWFVHSATRKTLHGVDR